MKCWHCEDCGREVLTVTKGYTPICECGDDCKEMLPGGSPKSQKALNPIKASKRAKKGK